MAVVAAWCQQPPDGTTVSLDLERIPAYNATTHVRMADVTFTEETKKKVSTGRILVPNYAEQDSDGVDVLSAAEFSARAQHYC